MLSNADEDTVDPFFHLRQATKRNFVFLKYFRLADPVYTKYLTDIPRNEKEIFLSLIIYVFIHEINWMHTSTQDDKGHTKVFFSSKCMIIPFPQNSS